MTLSSTLQIEERKGYLWITLPTGITVTNLLPNQEKIESHLPDNTARVVINLVNIDNINSVIASLIINVRNHVVDSGGSIGLINVSEKCRSKLDMMQLDRVLTIYKDESDIEAMGE